MSGNSKTCPVEVVVPTAAGEVPGEVPAVVAAPGVVALDDVLPLVLLLVMSLASVIGLLFLMPVSTPWVPILL